MAWHFCTSGSALDLAGIKANADLITYAGDAQTTLDTFSEHTEGEMMLETGMDLSGSLAGMDAGVRSGVANIAAAKIARKIVIYDVTGYLSRAQDAVLNLTTDITNIGMKQLKNFDNFSLKTPI